jgi:hypothetical protein
MQPLCPNLCRALLQLSPFYSLVVDPSAMAFMQIYHALFVAQEEDANSDNDNDKDSKADKADDLFSCAAAAFSLEDAKVWIAKQSSAGSLRNGSFLINEHVHGQPDLSVLSLCAARGRCLEEEVEGGQEAVPDCDRRAGGQLGGPSRPAQVRSHGGDPPGSAIPSPTRVSERATEGCGSDLHREKGRRRGHRSFKIAG